MRPLSILVAAAACLAFGAQASAQSRSSLYIQVQPRSWLDPGKAVTPHSMQNYMYDTAGGIGIGGGRTSNFGLLPDRFSGGSPIKIDIPAPDFLRK
jgi:hypothetical protein